MTVKQVTKENKSSIKETNEYLIHTCLPPWRVSKTVQGVENNAQWTPLGHIVWTRYKLDKSYKRSSSESYKTLLKCKQTHVRKYAFFVCSYTKKLFFMKLRLHKLFSRFNEIPISVQRGLPCFRNWQADSKVYIENSNNLQ